MAKGITQEQVNGAIDALVAAGERPTIERIRAELGTGSPNTVNRMLDVWWEQLAHRLAHRLALPGVPDVAGAAFAQAWEVALEAGKVHAEAQVAPERAALAKVLAKAEATVAAERATAAGFEARLRQAEAATTTQYNAWLVSDQHVGQLGREVAALQAMVQDLTVRRDALDSRLNATLEQAETERAAAATERAHRDSAHRAAEDRWLREVDRARQDEANVATQLKQLEKTSGVLAHKATQQINELSEQLRKARLDNAAKTARLAALEGQLDRLHVQLKERLGRPIAKVKPAATKKVGKARGFPA
jgi:hypothetical protein